MNLNELNLENVEAIEDFVELQPGPHLAEITDLELLAKKPSGVTPYKLSLKFENGSTRVYYSSINPEHLGFFKRVVDDINEANGIKLTNFTKETVLGKKVAVMAREEEYISSGEVRTGVNIANTLNYKKFKNNEYKIPSIKKLPNLAGIQDNELPPISNAY